MIATVGIMTAIVVCVCSITVWHVLLVTRIIPSDTHDDDGSNSVGVAGPLYGSVRDIVIPKGNEQVVFEHNTNIQPRKEPSLVIAGTVQNAESHLPHLYHSIQRAVQGFQVKALLFYENDSTDNTLAILHTWKQTTWSTLRILSETNVTLRERTDRLANGRNKLLDELVQRGDYLTGVDYVLMMDMDDVNYHLSHLDECLHLPLGFGACCANQYTMYYDLWALRAIDRSWVDYDVWRPGFSVKLVSKFFRHIPASAEPIPVHSCFGGATLYNATYLAGLPIETVKYVGTSVAPFSNETMRVCEHVSFHLGIRQVRPDFQMYIQPKFLNDGPSVLDKAGERGATRLKVEWKRSISDPSLFKYYRTMNSNDSSQDLGQGR